MFARRVALSVARRGALAAQGRAISIVGGRRVVAPAAGLTMPRTAAGLAGQVRFCTTIKCPAIAESITEGTIGSWSVKVGDAVEEDGTLGEIESDKASAPVRAPFDGIVTEILVEEGKTINVGDPILKMKEADISEMGSSDAPAEKEQKKEKKEEGKKEAPKKEEKKEKKPAPAAPVPSQQLAASTDREKRVRLSTMRKRIADRLKASQNTAAMLTTFQEVDMTNITNLRNQYKDEFFEKHGTKLGFMSAFVKASASALEAVPIINAYMDVENDSIVYHDYVDISVAVAIPSGLVVPVLRDVQDMNFADIEKSIAHYAEKAKAGQLTIPEMTGGTFTISNGGVYGSWMGTPIINPPQSAVLGMHAVKQKAWVDKNGNISARPIMALALTYDHRLIDGRDAVTFLVKIKNLIEDPQRLVLDLA